MLEYMLTLELMHQVEIMGYSDDFSIMRHEKWTL